jgi:hypothetical protein
MTKGDNEIIPGAVHRSLGIYLIADETPRKPQLGDRRRLCDQSSPQNEVGRITKHARKEEGRNIRMADDYRCLNNVVG